jgi:hypothetical protein
VARGEITTPDAVIPGELTDENQTPDAAFLNYWRVSVILTAIASALWAVSLYQISRSGLAVDDMGIINGLPVIYWAAIGILVIASAVLWRRSEEHPGLLFLQLGLLMGMFWFTPLINGHTLFGTRDAFAMHSLTKDILNTSHLHPDTMWYHNWPAVNLLEATMIQIGGIQNTDPLLIYAVIPIQLLFTLVIYTLFHGIFGRNNLWGAASLIFIVFNWTCTIIYAPQGIAFLMFLLTISLYIDIISHRDRVDERLLIIIMFFGLTVTHLLTSLALLFITITLGIIRKRGFFTLAMIFAVMLAIWLVYYSTTYFAGHFSRLLERILDLGNLIFQNLTVSNIGSEGHHIVVNTRVFFTAFAGLLGIAGLFLARWKKNRLDLVFLAMIIALLVMLPVQFYERELFSRIFLFMLPAITYFIVRLLSTRITLVILILLLIIALPFGIISLHGNQRWNTLPTDQLAHIHFLEENSYQGFEPYYQTSLIWLLDQPEASGASAELNETPEWRESVVVWSWLGREPPDLVSITPSERAMFWLFANAPNAVDETLEWLKVNSDYNYVYTADAVDAFAPR